MPIDNQKELWPGWKVVREIGQGSFGAVYEIQRDMFGKIESAALKVLTIPQSQNEIQELRSEGYDDASLTTHFRGYLEDIAREYSLMLDIKGHTNVVYCDDVRYVQHEDGIGWDVFIKMELLSPLMSTLSKTYEEQQVIKLGMDMCNALILCKNENIIHRDIKPQNIFVSKTGDYKLGDFGVAKIADKTVSGTKIGTFKYMAPEVYKSQPYGTASDLYSLGLVMYWAMNERRTPFLPLPPQIPTPSVDEEARQRRFSGEPVPAPANGSEALKQIVLKACAFDPADRFQDPAQMKDALARLQMSGTGMWSPPADEEEKTVGSFGGSRFAAPVTPVDDEEKTVGSFGGNRYTAPVTPVDEEEKTVGTFGGNRYTAPVTPVDEEEKTVGTFGGNRYTAPVTPVDEEEKTVGTFGGNRYTAPVTPVDEEEKTVGTFGGSRQTVSVPEDQDDHTVGAFGTRRTVATPVDVEDKTVGAFGSNRGATATVTPVDDGDKTVGAFGGRPVQTGAVKTEEKLTDTSGTGAAAGKPPIQPQQPVQPPKPDQPKTTGPAWTAFVDGSAPNPEQPPKTETTWNTPGVTATNSDPKKKTGMWIAIGTVAAILLAAAIAWFSYHGWLEMGGEKYYVVRGSFIKGFLETDVGTYYFDSKGRMQTGWENAAGDTYYFNDDGLMQTGWQTIGGNRYYFQDSGAMWKGWMTTNNETYYFDTDGMMLTGWQEILGTEYYFDENGRMATGWVSDAEGNVSYFDESGTAYTGWQMLDGNQYYFDPETGYRVTGWWTIDDQTYAFDENGVQLLGWVVAGEDDYYMAHSLGGAMAKGKWSIEGNNYYLDPETGILARGEVTLGDDEIAYFGDDGVFQYRETTKTNFWGDWSEEDVSFTTASGGNSTGGYQTMSDVYKNCKYVKITVEVVEVTRGNPDGEWQIHARGNGGDWVRLGSFNMSNHIGVAEFELDNFEFYQVIATSYNISDSNGWSGSLTLTVDELVYQSTDFGEVAGTE